MDRLKNFKKIADENMDHVLVTADLKKRSLQRLTKSPSAFSYSRQTLALAAAILLILGIVFWPRITPIPEISKTPSNERSLEPRTLQKEFSPLALDDPEVKILRELETLEEAKQSFTGFFNVPKEILSGFVLETIWASGDLAKSDQIILSYQGAKKGFVIRIEDSSLPLEYANFPTIEVEKTPVFVVVQTDLETEIHFEIASTHYSISGLLPLREASEIVRSILIP